MLKVYIAASLGGLDEAKAVMQAVRQAGGHITYDWTEGGRVTDLATDAPRVSSAEIEGVRAADVLVLLIPGGRGAHVELGAALALGLPVIVVGGHHDEIFYHHPLVVRLPPSPPDAIATAAYDVLTQWLLGYNVRNDHVWMLEAQVLEGRLAELDGPSCLVCRCTQHNACGWTDGTLDICTSCAEYWDEEIAKAGEPTTAEEAVRLAYRARERVSRDEEWLADEELDEEDLERSDCGRTGGLHSLDCDHYPHADGGGA